jgi:precorrin-2 dehydrogenase/sirohydrochlorin ferrochelatase
MKSSRKNAQEKAYGYCLHDLEVNKRIFELCRDRYLICNIADTLNYALYLGGIVTKGNVKIAISTNGKSPTTAKDCESFLKK